MFTLEETVKKGIFKAFFSNREKLIVEYGNGQISKNEYINKNIEYIKNINLQPFKIIDSFEKGMYNYQYFNMFAKYYFMESESMKQCEENSKYIQSFIDEGYYYYKLKDKATHELLKFLKFKDIDAYYIKLNSEYLDGKLYEINIKNHDKAILHSKNFKLLNILKSKGVFSDKTQTSIINEYVNERY